MKVLGLGGGSESGISINLNTSAVLEVEFHRQPFFLSLHGSFRAFLLVVLPDAASSTGGWYWMF